MSTFKGKTNPAGTYQQQQSSQYFHHNHQAYFMSQNHNPSSQEDEKPPPLPPKKRNIAAYMQMVGSYHGPNDVAFNLYRRSVHSYHSMNASNNQNITFCPTLQYQKSIESSFMQQCSLHQSYTSPSTSSSCSTLCGSKDSIQSYNSSNQSESLQPFSTTCASSAQVNQHLNLSSFSPEPLQHNRNFVTHSLTCSTGNCTQNMVNAAQNSINNNNSGINTHTSNDNNREDSHLTIVPPSLPPKRRPVPILPPIIRKSITPPTLAEPELGITAVNNANLDSPTRINEIESINNTQQIRPSSPVGQAPSSERFVLELFTSFHF